MNEETNHTQQLIWAILALLFMGISLLIPKLFPKDPAELERKYDKEYEYLEDDLLNVGEELEADK